MNAENQNAIRRCRDHLVRIGCPPRILVAEDNADMCELWKHYFADVEIDVDLANSGGDAICLIKSRTYDIVILDLWLGDMNGLQVISSVGDRSNFVIMTGYADSPKAKEAKTSGSILKFQKDPEKVDEQMLAMLAAMVVIAHSRTGIKCPSWTTPIIARIPALPMLTKLITKLL